MSYSLFRSRSLGGYSKRSSSVCRLSVPTCLSRTRTPPNSNITD